MDNKEEIQSPETKKQIKKANRLYVVGIGASAGGLEAINAFFEKVPEDSGLSFVLIQHLSPDYKSMMPELLAKHTMLKISKVTNGVVVQPNAIYTIPADKNITLSGGKLYLEDRGSPKTLNLPINIFFKSLAEDQKERAIGVVLSGTGSDATLGIEAIKQHGGMVIAQDPNSAAFDSMPKSAIGTGLVDFILHPTQMPENIVNYVKHPYVKHSEDEDSEETNLSKGNDLLRILNLIHKKTNLDFRQYKKSTISRRIERRMGIRNITNQELYYKYIQDDPEELEMLSQEMLIGVTAFFRDKKAFETLDKEVLKPMITNHNSSKEVRIWIVGCSTGQEAYSVGMLLKEHCRREKKHVPIKIFATDIDQRAIDKASKGIYMANIVEEVPKPLLSRYFNHIDGKYQVKKELREMAIFARHDITKDPPFNNIDLASCRNLLIYIEPFMQDKILSFIHFSLNERGYLFLGSSENPGSFNKVFEEVNKKYKLYRNISSVRIGDIHKLYPFDSKRKGHEKLDKAEDQFAGLSESKIIGNFKDALLEDLVPPTVIINENNDVVHVAGEIDQYIKLPKKQLTLNVLKMVDEQLYVSLSNIISKVKNQKKRVVSPPINFEGKEKSYLNIIAKHYAEPISRINYCIISFVEIGQSKVTLQDEHGGDSEHHKEKDAHIKRLEEDLKETKEYLQTTIEELETSNEELQSTNEELMAANEELQSSNEELQSVNEELYTVNNEFQDKLMEMTELNDDLNNFIQSTHIATLFLDNDLSIRRFTDEISPHIKITKNDIGRYIGDFTHSFQDFDLIKVAKKVLDSFMPIEQEVATPKNEVFLMRAMPYKTAKKEVKGVVFTFIAVTELKKIEQQLVTKARELERSNRELEQFAYVASHDLKAPITNLVALLDAIKNQNGIKEESAVLFERLNGSVSRMNNTIRTLNEVITLKKNLDLKPEKVKIQEALNDVLSGINDQVTSSHAEIKTNFKAIDTVLFPEIHLRNILQNLITNAIKYKKPKDNPIIELKTAQENGHICLVVKDNGRGIDMDEYGRKLFGLFQRFHLDTEGKGIGLHITKSIIESYGGRIEVDSQVGKGTTFKLYLPN